MRISDWSSDVCSSDLIAGIQDQAFHGGEAVLDRNFGRICTQLMPEFFSGLSVHQFLDPGDVDEMVLDCLVDEYGHTGVEIALVALTEAFEQVFDIVRDCRKIDVGSRSAGNLATRPDITLNLLAKIPGLRHHPHP